MRNFNGIILPFTLDGYGTGSILGITARELRYGGEDIELNFAFPRDERFSKFGLFWLENFPDIPEYSQKASYYWLLREFSKIGEIAKTAIRARPNEQRNSVQDYNFIFWRDGRPLPVGEQYGAAVHTMRNISLFDVVSCWQQEDYEVKYSDPVGKLDQVIEEHFSLSKLPHIQLERATEKLERESRNAGWKSRSVLIEEFI